MKYLKIKVYDKKHDRFLLSNKQSDKFIWFIQENGTLDILELDGTGHEERLTDLEIVAVGLFELKGDTM